MRDVKPIIAKNLAVLRKENGLTQAELAEKLNYSDKAISRWEHGDTLPDMNVICELCDFYGITLNSLVSEEPEFEKQSKKIRDATGYRIWLCALSVAIVWLCATLVYVYSQTVGISGTGNYWMAFVWAVPVSCAVVSFMGRGLPNRYIVSLICNSIFFWSLIIAVYLHFIVYNFWLLFIIGVPMEVVVVLWNKIRQFK